MGCGVYWQQVREVEKGISALAGIEFPGKEAAMSELYGKRGALIAEIGYKFPRVPAWLMDWGTYSPTLIRLAHDPEIGFVAAIRAYKGAPPTYKMVSDEVAQAIIKRELTPELEKELLTPDEYLGE